MAKHEVLRPVLHGTGSGKNARKLYGKGSTIELDAEDAQPLIDAGHLAPAGAKKAEDPAPAESTAATSGSKLSKMTVAELLDYAQAMNVVPPDGATKAVIIDAITAAQAAANQ